MFNMQFIQEYLVLQGGILSASLQGCMLVLAQVLSEGRERGSSVPFTYVGLALVRGGTKF